MNRTLSGATTQGHVWPRRDSNEAVLLISQRSSISGTSPLDCLWDLSRTLISGVLPLCKDVVGVFYSSSRLGHKTLVGEVWPPVYSSALADWERAEIVIVLWHRGNNMSCFVTNMSVTRFWRPDNIWCIYYKTVKKKANFYFNIQEWIPHGLLINCWCVCLFNGISTFVGYLMPNSSFEKNSSGTI